MLNEPPNPTSLKYCIHNLALIARLNLIDSFLVMKPKRGSTGLKISMNVNSDMGVNGPSPASACKRK